MEVTLVQQSLSRFLPEIKDDIMISQTVEILEPVLTDSKLRGESPPLDAGDVEDEKETKGEKIDKWSAKEFQLTNHSETQRQFFTQSTIRRGAVERRYCG